VLGLRWKTRHLKCDLERPAIKEERRRGVISKALSRGKENKKKASLGVLLSRLRIKGKTSTVVFERKNSMEEAAK